MTAGRQEERVGRNHLNRKEDENIPFEEPDSMPREVKGILVYHRGRDKRNKSITWKPDADIVAIKYFELDEGERINVNKVKFETMRNFEAKHGKGCH